WMLHLFEAQSTKELLRCIGDPHGEDRQPIGEDGLTDFHRHLLGHLGRKELTVDQLREYDQNVVRHWRAIPDTPSRREHTLKHFQYLALLFTEVYLDRYFRDANGLLRSLNDFVEAWNGGTPALTPLGGRPPADQATPFEADDLNKL